MGRKGDLRRWRAKRIGAKRLRKGLKRLKASRRASMALASVFVSADGVTKIKMPELISLGDLGLHDTLAATMAKLRMAFASGSREVRVDFSYTTGLHAEGMLLVYAELTRLTDAFSEVNVSCVPSRVAKVDQALQHLGVYGMLGHKSPVDPELPDAVNWRVARGANVDGPKMGELIEEIGRLSSETASKLFRSVTEAVTNVTHHSDLAERLDGLELEPTKEWWMFCRPEKHSLYVAVCDLGIGIPRSLPRTHPEIWTDVLYRMFGDRRMTDGRMIKAALRMRRSRTEEEHRGMGFSDITRVLEEVDGSQLRVYSNRGSLQYSNPSLIPAIHIHNFKYSILGTILVWSFPFRDDQHVK